MSRIRLGPPLHFHEPCRSPVAILGVFLGISNVSLEDLSLNAVFDAVPLERERISLVLSASIRL